MLTISNYSSYSYSYTGYLRSVKSNSIPAQNDTNTTVTDEPISHRTDLDTEQHQKLLGGFVSSPLLNMESIVDMGINDWQNEQMIGSNWLSINGNVHGISSYISPNSSDESPVVGVYVDPYDEEDACYVEYSINEIDPSKASVLEMYALLSYKDHMDGNEAGVQNMASWKLNSFREAYDYRIVSTNYADIKECLNEKSNWIDLNDAAKESLKEIDMLEPDKVTETQWHEIFNEYITKIYNRMRNENSQIIEKLFEV